MPKRIQMTRSKPWRKDNPDAIIVARPSKWGNPYVVGEHGDAAKCVETYSEFIGIFLGHQMQELKGKDLACWCPLDQPCHADVLLKIANE